MKRFSVLFFTAALLLAANYTISIAQETIGYSAEQLGINFSQIAMSEFGSENPGQDTSLLASRAQEYGREMAGILLRGKVKPQDAMTITNDCAPWYATALTRILKGTSLNIYINDYIKMLTNLFSEYKVDIDLQSNIVLLTSSHLEKMNGLLNPSFYNYQ